jgi:hypothetical protein
MASYVAGLDSIQSFCVHAAGSDCSPTKPSASAGNNAQITLTTIEEYMRMNMHGISDDEQ